MLLHANVLFQFFQSILHKCMTEAVGMTPKTGLTSVRVRSVHRIHTHQHTHLFNTEKQLVGHEWMQCPARKMLKENKRHGHIIYTAYPKLRSVDTDWCANVAR